MRPFLATIVVVLLSLTSIGAYTPTSQSTLAPSQQHIPTAAASTPVPGAAAAVTQAPVPVAATSVAATTAQTDSSTSSSFYTDFTRDGKPLKKGGEIWKLETNTIVTNMWGGLPIGNVAAGTELMIERYLYAKDQSEEATYGWGFVLNGSENFGGWFRRGRDGAKTSCGWFPLQRDFLGRRSTRAVKLEEHSQHRPHCEPYSNNFDQFHLKTIQHKGGMIDGHDGLGVVHRMKVEKPCKLYLNFDKSLQTFVGDPIMTILPGEGEKSLLGRRYIVEGLTPKAAVVQTMFGVDNKGWQGWFFTENSCLAEL